MHESHQVQHLVSHAQKMIAEKKIVKPVQVSVAVGEALGFDEMSMRLHWEEFVSGTSLEGVKLAVRFVPVQFQCPACAALFPKKGSQMSCPKCRVMGKPVDSGKEFFIEAITS
ncbi:MAG: hydrogenase maturation nickel metallochaperone HypA [Candidatus Omnitrophica bacterium]|nr:hydrogenase maturation nickel metallochaperone HypA [Candidatus Omnitrophota bacterium]